MYYRGSRDGLHQYQEFHLLTRIGCGKMRVFSPLKLDIPYYYLPKGWLLRASLYALLCAPLTLGYANPVLPLFFPYHPPKIVSTNS